MKRRAVLESIRWAEEYFGSLHTNSQCTRRDVMRAVKAGLVESAGMTTPCDGDGALLAGRADREGFKLTAKGMALL